MTILNLTQHPATPAQIEAGVVEPQNKGRVVQLLTFEALPDREIIWEKAIELAYIAYTHDVLYAMVGGAPYLMAALERALSENTIIPVYAYSLRVSVESTLPDGRVVKTNELHHLGFVNLKLPTTTTTTHQKGQENEI